MNAESLVAEAFLKAHPVAAAQLLEKLDSRDASAVIESANPRVAAEVIRHMLPTAMAACAVRVNPKKMSELVALLPIVSGATVLRRLPSETTQQILNGLGTAHATALKLVLKYPVSTVGAWMNPNALTLANDATVSQASASLEDTDHEQQNMYVLDRAGKLCGSVGTRKLLSSSDDEEISRLIEPTSALWARIHVSAAHTHDIWEETSVAPVVNRNGEFIGDIAFGDVRRAYRQLGNPIEVNESDSGAGELGDLFVGGLESAWDSLGELLNLHSTNPPRSSQ